MPRFLVKIDKDCEILRDTNTGLALKCKANEAGEIIGIIKQGDILLVDEYAYVYFMDRQGDTFRWKGGHVSRAEIEIVMSECLGLKDTAVYAVHIPGAGGRGGMASIVDPEGHVNFPKLAKNLKNELPPYAQPVLISIFPEMPMTGSLKL